MGDNDFMLAGDGWAELSSKCGSSKVRKLGSWISDLESRDTGLCAHMRWSDAGLSAVQGGRFRLVSPVFPAPDACEDLGGDNIRPVKLVSIGPTNVPNIKGGKPIANREPVANRDGDAKKYRWVLGSPPSGEHCGVCPALGPGEDRPGVGCDGHAAVQLSLYAGRGGR